MWFLDHAFQLIPFYLKMWELTRQIVYSIPLKYNGGTNLTYNGAGSITITYLLIILGSDFQAILPSKSSFLFRRKPMCWSWVVSSVCSLFTKVEGKKISLHLMVSVQSRPNWYFPLMILSLKFCGLPVNVSGIQFIRQNLYLQISLRSSLLLSLPKDILKILINTSLSFLICKQLYL